MASRHFVNLVLFAMLAAALSLFGPRTTQSAPAASNGETERDIPQEALEAMREGRYLRASMILRDYLAAHPDTSAAALLLAAQAEAGLGDWERVRQLLEGRGWLDVVAAGQGWRLLGRSQIELGRFDDGVTSLARYLDMAPPSGRRDEGVTLIRRAGALAGANRTAEALDAYDKAAGLLPHIEDWILVHAASAAAAAGDTAAVRERLSRVDSTLAREWSWRTIVHARRTAGDLRGAQTAAEQAAAGLTGSRRAAAWNVVAGIRVLRGDRAGARTAYLRAVRDADGSVAEVDAARGLAALGPVSHDDHLVIGRIYLRHRNHTRGAAALQAWLDSGAGSPAERDRARYDIAIALLHAGRHRSAEVELLAMAASIQDRVTAADAVYAAARAQYRDGRPAHARATLNRVIRDFPDQPAAARAAFLLADLHHDELELSRANNLYRTVIQLAPGSDEAAVSRMRLAGIAFAERRFRAALRELEEYRLSHTEDRNRQQAAFWTGRVLDAMGRHDEARAHFAEARRIDPFSYYGGLADELLDDDVWHLRLDHPPPLTGRYDHAIDRALARVDMLRDIGWNDAASFEMERVRRHFARFDGASYALAEMLNERGFISAGIAIGREIHRREGAWNIRLLRIVYPFPFRSIITAEARERGVDPALAAALIRQESLFDPSARSPVGALGLMQVMPRTGADLARSLRIASFRTDMLLQPEINIHLGMAYLAQQIRSHGDRLDAVLAAYNAGPGRVQRWRRFPEWQDRHLFAERIPFDETRNYVRIVQTNRRLYELLYR